MARLDGGQCQCLECGYQSKKFNGQCHVEAKHVISPGYSCSQCNEIIQNRIALKHHLAKFHRNNKFVICFLYFTDLFESLMVSLGGGKWQCVQCGHQSQKFNVKCHIEAKHMESFEYPCPQCHEILKNRWALKNHVTKFHR